jgi:tRNA threonylcarbamoyl adenosine modification protein YeaZ
VENVLALVGCGPRLEVALASRHSREPGLVVLAGPVPRSELVMAAVDLLLRAADVRPADLEAVMATRGPGSFTGIRVSLATAQGLAEALRVPARGVSSLLVQAARCEDVEVLAAQPARRGFVYVQPFRCSAPLPVALADPEVRSIAELAQSPLPVVAPPGLELSPDTPRAMTRRGSAEALLNLAGLAAASGVETLAPIYVEASPAMPPARPFRPWPPSPKAT